jgi:prevent-host-death family protein
MRWQLEDAKQQLSRVVERARAEGPQVLTRNGKEVAVLLDVDDYRRLRSDDGAFKRFLTSGASFDGLELEPSVDLAPAFGGYASSGRAADF